MPPNWSPGGIFRDQRLSELLRITSGERARFGSQRLQESRQRLFFGADQLGLVAKARR